MRKLWEAEHQRSSPACCSYLNTCLEGALALHQGLFRRSPDCRSSDLRIPTFPFLRVFLSGHQHSNDELREYDKRAAKHSQPPNKKGRATGNIACGGAGARCAAPACSARPGLARPRSPGVRSGGRGRRGRVHQLLVLPHSFSTTQPLLPARLRPRVLAPLPWRRAAPYPARGLAHAARKPHTPHTVAPSRAARCGKKPG